MDQLNPAFNFVHTFNIPVESLQIYQEQRLDVIDMELHGSVMKQQGVGRTLLINTRHYASKLKDSEFTFYEKCLKPSNIFYLNGVLLDDGLYRWAMLAVHRPENLPEYTHEDAQLLERLGKHLRRALQIYRQLIEARQSNRDLNAILDCLKTGVILLDNKKSIIYSNTNAQQTLRRSCALTVDRFNHLKTNNKYQATLDQYILTALFQKQLVSDEDIGGVLALTERDESKLLMLSIVPFSSVCAGVLSDTQPKVAIFLTQPDQYYLLAKRFLRQHYDLSKRETEICELFVNGFNLEEVSEKSNIALSTVRTYIKSIFLKTKCNSQPELMRLLMGLMTEFEHIH